MIYEQDYKKTNKSEKNYEENFMDLEEPIKNNKLMKKTKNPKNPKNPKTNKNKIHKEKENNKHENELNLSLEEEDYNNKSMSESSNIELSKHDRTVIIKNLLKTVDEEELQNFINDNSPNILIEDVRIVRDKKGFSKGYAFVDFLDKLNAEKCVKNINGKILEDNVLSCAISKPPSAG